MNHRPYARRLAAILHADVAGYSRLMGLDEDATHRALGVHLDALTGCIERHGGRVAHFAGDAVLADFESVLAAVTCAITAQRELAHCSRDLPSDRKIRFRIGVNLGEVIDDRSDIFGEGVNVAARLESIAPPGGICISNAVFEQVRRKLHLETEDLGECALKNIETPIRVHRIVSRSAEEVVPGEPEDRRTSIEQLALYETPSIAILPFRNLSADPEDDFIADGIALGVQTLLVQLPGLFLVNAIPDRAYQNETKTAERASHELAVRYVLQGTVQRAGRRVRVSVQVTDAREGSVIWAERYDRELDDVFALQDDITREVVSSLEIEIRGAETARIALRGLEGNGAWEYFLRGVSYVYKSNKQDNARAREMFEKLYELRPDRAQGPGYIALTYWLDLARGWADSPAEALEHARKWAAMAMQYRENDGLGHVIMSDVRLRDGRHEEALRLCQQGVALRTNCPVALGQVAKVQLYCGEPRQALKSARESLSVRTLCPPAVVNLLAAAYRDCGEIERSIPAAREAVRIDPNYTDALATLCTDYALAGDVDEAHRVASAIVALDPTFRISSILAQHPYKDASSLGRLAEALRTAGLQD